MAEQANIPVSCQWLPSRPPPRTPPANAPANWQVAKTPSAAPRAASPAALGEGRGQARFEEIEGSEIEDQRSRKPAEMRLGPDQGRQGRRERDAAHACGLSGLARAFGPEHERHGQGHGRCKYAEIEEPVTRDVDSVQVAKRMRHGDEGRGQCQVQHEDAGVVRQQRAASAPAASRGAPPPAPAPTARRAARTERARVRGVPALRSGRKLRRLRWPPQAAARRPAR